MEFKGGMIVSMEWENKNGKPCYIIGEVLEVNENAGTLEIREYDTIHAANPTQAGNKSIVLISMCKPYWLQRGDVIRELLEVKVTNTMNPFGSGQSVVNITYEIKITGFSTIGNEIAVVYHETPNVPLMKRVRDLREVELVTNGT